MSVRRKLMTLGIAGLTATVIAGGVGFVALRNALRSADELQRTAVAQRQQMIIDQFHDQLRAAAFGGLRGAAQHRPEDVAKAAKEFDESSVTMQAGLDTLVGMSIGDDGLRRAKAAVPRVAA